MTDKTRLQENYLSGLEKALPAALKEIDDLTGVFTTHHILSKDVPALLHEVRRLRAVVEVYADRGNWVQRSRNGVCFDAWAGDKRGYTAAWEALAMDGEG